MSGWRWTCSACPEVFTGTTSAEAEGKFLAHARTAHNPKTIISIDITINAAPAVETSN